MHRIKSKRTARKKIVVTKRKGITDDYFIETNLAIRNNYLKKIKMPRWYKLVNFKFANLE